MAKQKSEKTFNPPDPTKKPLTEVSATRLSAMSGVPAEHLVGATVAEISAKFGHIIDPQLLFYRRICGQVVKTDPSTGIANPVPFATVYVEDTDCSFLGFFPEQVPWSWLFPFFCRREVIAQTRTDACGDFCVWVPRWDIDWVVRWRFERICFPVVFERPSVLDVINQVFPERRPVVGPNPGPIVPVAGPSAPGAADVDRAQFERRLGESIGAVAARRVLALGRNAGFGARRGTLDAALAAPAFAKEIAPPLPEDLKIAVHGDRHGESADAAPGAVRQLAAKLRLEAEDLGGLSLNNYIGPFKRCYDLIVPQWTPILDVPDITFRVTQDIDGDGVEEPIYSESYLQVRWNDTSPAPVVINADPQARAGIPCSTVDVPCGNVPAIVLAGMLPVTDEPTLWDSVQGVSLRTNRPHPTGAFADPSPLPDAAAPLYGGVSLLGCLGRDTGASTYRVLYEYSTDGGSTYTAPAPFVDRSWPLYRLSDDGLTLESLTVSSDSSGWYPVDLPPGLNDWEPANILLVWPTGSYADGLYRLTVQLDTDTPTHPARSAPVGFTIDNSSPRATMSVEYSFSDSAGWLPLGGICPVVRRNAAPADVYFRVTLNSSAEHLRSTQLWAGDCGGGSFQFQSGTGGVAEPSSTVYERWHESVGDNSATLQAIYLLPSTAQQGTYSFGSEIVSRAFNPQGGDNGELAIPAWQYDPADIYIEPNFAFSVIDAAPLP